MQTNTEQKEQHTFIPLLHLHTHPAHVHTRARTHTHGFSCSFLLLLYLFLFSLVHTPPLLPFSSLSLLATLSHPVLSLLSSPLFLFLFPLHSLMLGLSQQTDPRSETGGAVPCKLSITGCWPMGAENLLSHVLQLTTGGRRRGITADRGTQRLFISLFLCMCVCV